MRSVSMLAAGTALLTIAAASPQARAQSVTPAQQAALEAQLRSWYTLGDPAFAAASTQIQITPAGDHFDVVAPVRLRGASTGDLQVTGAARPGDNGKWSFAGVRTAVPFKLAVQMPAPPPAGKRAAARQTLLYTVDAASQDGTIEYDPSFATPSSWTSAIRGMTIRTSGAGLEQTSDIAAVDGTTTLTPAQDNRLDLVTNGTLTGYRLDSKAAADTPAITASIGKASVAASLTGLDRDKAAGLIAVLGRVGKLAEAAPAGQPPALPPALVAELTTSLQGLASRMVVSESFDTVKLDLAGMAFSLAQVRMGLDSRSEQGLFRAVLDLGLQGLAMPDFGLGELEALIPRNVSLRPYVSGLPVEDLSRIMAALAKKQDPKPADMAALFSHGGVVTGLESLAIELGSTSFAGEGKLTMTGPHDLAGTARLTADNFDALIQSLGAIPMAAQAMPVAIFLKGIARNDGGKLVWDLTYTGDRILVNAIDLSAMTGRPAPQGPNPDANPGGAPKTPAPRPSAKPR
ncbi:MAG: hypothetical protein ACRYGM_28335 [Janthinobacterium lividum]